MIVKIGLALFGLYVLAQLPFNTPQKAPLRGGKGTIEFQGSKEPSVAPGQERPKGKPYDPYQREIDQAWMNQHKGIKSTCMRFNPRYPNGKPVTEGDIKTFNAILKRGNDDYEYRQSIGDREEAAAGLKEVEKLRAEGKSLGYHDPGTPKTTTRGTGGDTGRLAKFGHSPEPERPGFVREKGYRLATESDDPDKVERLSEAETARRLARIDNPLPKVEQPKPVLKVDGGVKPMVAVDGTLHEPGSIPTTQTKSYEEAVARVRANAIKQEQRIQEMTNKILAGKEPTDNRSPAPRVPSGSASR